MTTTDSPRPIARPAEDLLHRRDLAADVDGRPLGRRAGPRDRPLDVAGDPAQVLARDVGGQAHRPLHVVAVVLARHRPRADLGHVAEQELPVQAGLLDRHRLDCLERVHDLVGDLDLHLVADAGLGVGPVVGHHEAARRGGRDDRAGDVLRRSRRSSPARSRSTSTSTVG